MLEMNKSSLCTSFYRIRMVIDLSNRSLVISYYFHRCQPRDIILISGQARSLITQRLRRNHVLIYSTEQPLVRWIIMRRERSIKSLLLNNRRSIELLVLSARDETSRYTLKLPGVIICCPSILRKYYRSMMNWSVAYCSRVSQNTFFFFNDF